MDTCTCNVKISFASRLVGVEILGSQAIGSGLPLINVPNNHSGHDSPGAYERVETLS